MPAPQHYGALMPAYGSERSPANPRGWVKWLHIDLDARTPDYAAKFAERFHGLVTSAIVLCKRWKLTGAVWWNVEGHEFNQPEGSYIGYPFPLPPEVAAIMKDECRRFPAAGLEIGFLLRWTNLVAQPYGPPLQMVTGEPLPILKAKVNQCKAAYGATLFYLDSFCAPESWNVNKIEGQTPPPGKIENLPPDVLTKLHNTYSDCTFFPEYTTASLHKLPRNRPFSLWPAPRRLGAVHETIWIDDPHTRTAQEIADIRGRIAAGDGIFVFVDREWGPLSEFYDKVLA